MFALTHTLRSFWPSSPSESQVIGDRIKRHRMLYGEKKMWTQAIWKWLLVGVTLSGLLASFLDGKVHNIWMVEWEMKVGYNKIDWSIYKHYTNLLYLYQNGLIVGPSFMSNDISGDWRPVLLIPILFNALTFALSHWVPFKYRWSYIYFCSFFMCGTTNLKRIRLEVWVSFGEIIPPQPPPITGPSACDTGS